jgi:hypothetical protein
MFWKRRNESAKPGALIATFEQLAPKLQSPQDLQARAVFNDRVKEAWDYHGVQSHDALPPSTLRDLELLLALVHRGIPQFEDEMMKAGVAPQALVDALREGLKRPELVERAQLPQQSRPPQPAQASQPPLPPKWTRSDQPRQPPQVPLPPQPPQPVGTEQDAPQQNRADDTSDDLVAWLATQPANVWHEVAVNYDWNDDPSRDLGWIIEQPFCDLATAMQVFLFGRPDYFDAYKTIAEIPEQARPVFQLVDNVASRIVEGAYPMRRFAVDEAALADRQAYQQQRVARGEFIRWVLPEDAFGPFERRATNSPFLYQNGKVSKR